MAADNVKLSKYYGAAHFASSINWEPQRDSHWELCINLTGIKFPENMNTVRQNFTAMDEETLRLSVQSVNLPALSVTATPLQRNNDKVHFATNPQMGGSGMSIQCVDAIGFDMQNLLLDWFRTIYNFDGDRLMGLAFNYKTTATLFVFAPDASIIRGWEIEGVFPTQLTIPNMGTGGNFTNIQASFSCDRLKRITIATSNT